MKHRIILFSLVFVLFNLAQPCFSQASKANLVQMLKRANELFYQIKYDSSVMLCDSAADISLRLKDSVFYYSFESLKARIAISRGENDTAKVILSTAWNFALRNKIDTLRAYTDNALGYIFLTEGYFSSAFIYFQSALSVYEKYDNKARIVQTYVYLSNYYFDNSDYVTALDYALKSIRIADSVNDDNKVMYMISLLNLGNVYERLKEPDSAVACYNKVYDYTIKNDLLYIAVKALTNKAIMIYARGNSFYMQGNTEEAKKYFKQSEEVYFKAIEIVDSLNSKAELTILYMSLGPIYRKMGDFEKAEMYYLKALEYARESNDITKQIVILKNYGMLFKAKGDYATAKKYYEESLKLARKYNNKILIGDIYKSLATLSQQTGNYNDAFEFMSDYSAINDSIFSLEKSKLSGDLIFQFDREKDKAMIKDLESQNKIAYLENKTMRFERRMMYGILIAIIIFLILIMSYFRMKSNKNKIIAQQRIQKLEDEKRLMESQSVMIGEENERKRIAQELHDGIGVLLSTASIQFSGITSKVNDPGTVELINKAGKFLKEAGQEVRKISQNMMPSVLSKFGLREALEDIFDEIEDMGQIETNVMIESDNVRLPENMEIMLYRVVQELANNTIKHSRATKIIFSFVKKIDVIEIDFQDNGAGFDPNRLPHNKSLGIYGIRSRVDFLKGTVELESSPGEGTKYYIRIPVAT